MSEIPNECVYIWRWGKHHGSVKVEWTRMGEVAEPKLPALGDLPPMDGEWLGDQIVLSAIETPNPMKVYEFVKLLLDQYKTGSWYRLTDSMVVALTEALEPLLREFPPRKPTVAEGLEATIGKLGTITPRVS